MQATRNCTELPVEVLKIHDLPSLLRLDGNHSKLQLEHLLEVKITKRTKKRNKWNVSYISGASFTENKKGFPPQIADSMTIFSIKPVHGILRNPNDVHNLQIRGFKSQRSIKSDLESNSSLGSKIMKWFGALPGQQDKGALNLSRDHEFQALKSAMQRGEATADDRVKLAFAEGYLEGHSRKSPERFLSWIRALQSIISFSLFLFIIMIIAYKCKFHIQIIF